MSDIIFCVIYLIPMACVIYLIRLIIKAESLLQKVVNEFGKIHPESSLIAQIKKHLKEKK